MWFITHMTRALNHVLMLRVPTVGPLGFVHDVVTDECSQSTLSTGTAAV